MNKLLVFSNKRHFVQNVVIMFANYAASQKDDYQSKMKNYIKFAINVIISYQIYYLKKKKKIILYVSNRKLKKLINKKNH